MTLNGNWIDLVIILVLIYFVSEAWRHGFWIILAEFLSFLGSILIALWAYKFAAIILTKNFNLPGSIANAAGFLISAVLVEIMLGYIFAYLITRLPEKIRRYKYHKLLAVIPALGQGLILIAFILTLLIGLPIKPQIKEDITNAKIGGILINHTSSVEKTLNDAFGGVVNDSLTYLTIKPDSSETVKINAGKKNLSEDRHNEKAMFDLVNKERQKLGISNLEWSDDMASVGRDYARDMWMREYFSHYSPEGKDVGDRLQEAKIKYFLAGENLALAPTLTLAHDGLMKSEGHRANILEERYRKIGIGVIDNGYYGKIFVQVFSD